MKTNSRPPSLCVEGLWGVVGLVETGEQDVPVKEEALPFVSWLALIQGQAPDL